MNKELGAVAAQLAGAQDRSATLARDLKEARRLNASSARSRNEALRGQFEELSRLRADAEGRASAAAAKLQELQQLGTQAAAVFLTKFDEIKEVSVTTTRFVTPNSDTQADNTAELNATIAELQQRVLASEVESLKKDTGVFEEVAHLRNTVASLTHDLEVAQGAHQAQLQQAKTEFSMALAQASTLAQVQAATALEEVKKIQAVMVLNAAEVATAASYKEQLETALRQLEQSSKGREEAPTPVGQKRRR
jgi:hypothetical protein